MNTTHKRPAEYYRNYYQKNRVKKLLQDKLRRTKNPEKERTYWALYRAKNKDQIRNRFQLWYKENSESQRQWQKSYRAKNREHLLQQAAKYRANNRLKLRTAAFGYKLKSLYGLTVSQFQGMWTNQNGKCSICETVFKERKSAHVDHDNGNGKIRGLLCSNCNLGIGSLKHDPTILRNAIRYLNGQTP